MTASQMDWSDFWSGKSLPKDLDRNSWLEVQTHFTQSLIVEKIAAATGGKLMLECGCGSARFSRFMARRGYDCTILDANDVALNAGVVGFREDELPVKGTLGDINKLPFLDGQFDVVYSGGVLEFFSEIETPITEMYRVLKPGGILVASMVPRKFSIQTIADLQRTFVHAAKQILSNGSFRGLRQIKIVPDDYPVSRRGLKDYVGAAKKAGFCEVKGYGMSPFPNFSLPVFLHRQYARFMLLARPFWRWFNLSQSVFSRVFGITIVVFARKTNIDGEPTTHLT